VFGTFRAGAAHALIEDETRKAEETAQEVMREVAD